jgi:hypothetical protein
MAEPLRFNTPIVDATGLPTVQFQRLWAQLSLSNRLTVSAANDTTLTFSYIGSDGVTRSASLTLA